MVCYHPISAVYNIAEYKRTGKKNIQLVVHQDTEQKRKLTKLQYPPNLYKLIHIPCGKCAGCRSDNAKMWSLRAMNELKLHDKNCFITLTYNDDNPLVAQDPLCLVSLRYKHFQNFMKRLRKKTGEKIQFLMCGEYGSLEGRSHFHCILFGYDFPDKQLVYISKGYPHYSSQLLNECWSVYDKVNKIYQPIGFTDLAPVDLDCCNYVSGYVLKKLPNVLQNPEVIQGIELVDRCPPMIRSSRKPALGLNWYKQYGKNACEKGFQYVHNEKKGISYKVKTPNYYMKKFELDEPEIYAKVKEEREKKFIEMMKQKPPNYDELERREQSHLYRIIQSVKDKIMKRS